MALFILILQNSLVALCMPFHFIVRSNKEKCEKAMSDMFTNRSGVPMVGRKTEIELNPVIKVEKDLFNDIHSSDNCLMTLCGA